MLSVYVVCWVLLQTFQIYFCIQASSVVPDQTAPFWSGSTLFAKMTFKITNRWQSRRQLLWLAVWGLRGFDLYARFSFIFLRNNFKFCEIISALPHNKPLLKRHLLQKERYYPRIKYFPFRIDLYYNHSNRVAVRENVNTPLKWLWHCLYTNKALIYFEIFFVLIQLCFVKDSFENLFVLLQQLSML